MDKNYNFTSMSEFYSMAFQNVSLGAKQIMMRLTGKLLLSQLLQFV